MTPRVSVVIPTHMRPDLVARAVRSALAQSVTNIEVIVTVDGRDKPTCAALQSVADKRLVIHVPERRLGNADARNAGVALARAEWVAFLDDDDEWLPQKLEAQLRMAESGTHAHPMVTCRLIARDEDGERIWPRRLPRDGEPLSEYFFCRTSPFTGEGMVINSGILTSRELAVRVPFRSGLERHVDPDWMLRAARVPGAALVFVTETDPLVIWHVEKHRQRITTRPDWMQSLDYCSRNRDLFTPRGYAAFVLHVVGSSAAAQGKTPAFTRLLR
ncbi:MAG TPA: glycosyltransferase family 2 protein, partial [Gemmatimonadaceae bacterium]